MTTPKRFENRDDGEGIRAVGLDPVAEVRRILAAGTADIIVGSDRPDPDHNVRTLALVNAALRRDYRPVFRIRIGSRERIVYQRLRP